MEALLVSGTGRSLVDVARVCLCRCSDTQGSGSRPWQGPATQCLLGAGRNSASQERLQTHRVRSHLEQAPRVTHVRRCVRAAGVDALSSELQEQSGLWRQGRLCGASLGALGCV